VITRPGQVFAPACRGSPTHRGERRPGRYRRFCTPRAAHRGPAPQALTLGGGGGAARGGRLAVRSTRDVHRGPAAARSRKNLSRRVITGHLLVESRSRRRWPQLPRPVGWFHRRWRSRPTTMPGNRRSPRTRRSTHHRQPALSLAAWAGRSRRRTSPSCRRVQLVGAPGADPACCSSWVPSWSPLPLGPRHPPTW